MNLYQYIAVSPDIQFGKPDLKRTRVIVNTHLEEGLSLDEILEGLPAVSKEQAEAVIQSGIKDNTNIE